MKRALLSLGVLVAVAGHANAETVTGADAIEILEDGKVLVPDEKISLSDADVVVVYEGKVWRCKASFKHKNENRCDTWD